MSTRRKRPSALDHLGPETCVIYTRISQSRDGDTTKVETQEQNCRAKAAALGLEVTHVYVDNDASATSGKRRPEFEAMLAARPEVIIAWHQDRLLRLTSDLERVIDLGVDVHFVKSSTLDLATPAGRAVGRTVAAWSQYEGEQKAERQYAANKQRAESGHWQFSRRPYGYRRVGQGKERSIEIVEPEAEIVRELYRRYNAGESLYALANDLNARGVPTVGDGTRTADETSWSMRRVQQILRNEHYAGIVTHLGEAYPDATPTWEPIIDARTWSDYLETRDGRKRPGGWSTSTKHLLSGLLICDVCGARMLARPEYRKGKDGERVTYQAYACQAKWCTHILARDIEPIVEATILARLQDKRIVRALRQTPDTAPAQKEIAELRARRQRVIDMVADGTIARREASRQLDDLAARIDVLQARVASARRESPLTDLVLSRTMLKRWRSLGVLDRRRVIDELGLRVSIKRARPGRRPLGADGHPIPDTSRIVVAWADADA